MPLPSLSLASTNGPGHDFVNGDEDAARFEIPTPSTNYALSVGFAFSIYSNLVSFLHSRFLVVTNILILFFSKKNILGFIGYSSRL
jgi:hypothetical protein